MLISIVHPFTFIILKVCLNSFIQFMFKIYLLEFMLKKIKSKFKLKITFLKIKSNMSKSGFLNLNFQYLEVSYLNFITLKMTLKSIVFFFNTFT